MNVTSDANLGEVSLWFGVTGASGAEIDKTFTNVNVAVGTTFKAGLYLTSSMTGTLTITVEAIAGACVVGRGTGVSAAVVAGKAIATVSLHLGPVTGCETPRTQADAGVDGAIADVPVSSDATGAGGAGAGGAASGGSSGMGGSKGGGQGGGGAGGLAAGETTGSGGAGVGGTAGGGMTGMGGLDVGGSNGGGGGAAATGGAGAGGAATGGAATGGSIGTGGVSPGSGGATYIGVGFACTVDCFGTAQTVYLGVRPPQTGGSDVICWISGSGAPTGDQVWSYDTDHRFLVDQVAQLPMKVRSSDNAMVVGAAAMDGTPLAVQMNGDGTVSLVFDDALVVGLQFQNTCMGTQYAKVARNAAGFRTAFAVQSP